MCEMNELVSVLMCVYNTPIEYLKEAVNSILDQTYQNLEFVIVDDASDKEDVVNYLDTIHNSEIKIQVIRNRTNLGLTRSLNIGLERCNGKYITRMDSDDISLPQRIQKQVEYMRKYTDVALLGSDIICFGRDISEFYPSEEQGVFNDPDIYRVRSLFEHSGPPHPTFMLRTEFLENNKIRYRNDILKAQDYGIMADILRVGGVINRISEPLLKYRVHNGQITNNHETEQKLYQCRVSFDYAKAIFPILTEAEQAAFSLLGCSVDWECLLMATTENPELNRTCSFVIENRRELEKPGVYINTVRKCIQFNQKTGMFDNIKFATEIRYRWWKKASRMSREKRRIWGLSIFTIISYLYAIKRLNYKQNG